MGDTTERCMGHDMYTWSAAQCIELATGEDGLCERHRETPVAVPVAVNKLLKAENARLRERVAALEGALRDFADRGLRCDLLPTGGHRRDADWWHDYLASADKHVRLRARAALVGQTPTRVGEE